VGEKEGLPLGDTPCGMGVGEGVGVLVGEARVEGVPEGYADSVEVVEGDAPGVRAAVGVPVPLRVRVRVGVPVGVAVTVELGDGVALGLAPTVMVGVGVRVPEAEFESVEGGVGVPVVERLRVRVALGVPEGVAPREGDAVGVRDVVWEGVADSEVVGVVVPVAVTHAALPSLRENPLKPPSLSVHTLGAAPVHVAKAAPPQLEFIYACTENVAPLVAIATEPPLVRFVQVASPLRDAEAEVANFRPRGGCASNKRRARTSVTEVEIVAEAHAVIDAEVQAEVVLVAHTVPDSEVEGEGEGDAEVEPELVVEAHAVLDTEVRAEEVTEAEMVAVGHAVLDSEMEGEVEAVMESEAEPHPVLLIEVVALTVLVEETLALAEAVVEPEAEAHSVLLIEAVELIVLVEETLALAEAVVEPEAVTHAVADTVLVMETVDDGELEAMAEAEEDNDARELVGFPERVTAGDAEGDIVAFPEWDEEPVLVLDGVAEGAARVTPPPSGAEAVMDDASVAKVVPVSPPVPSLFQLGVLVSTLVKLIRVCAIMALSAAGELSVLTRTVALLL
jgi:hypothetical protein